MSSRELSNKNGAKKIEREVLRVFPKKISIFLF